MMAEFCQTQPEHQDIANHHAQDERPDKALGRGYRRTPSDGWGMRGRQLQIEAVTNCPTELLIRALEFGTRADSDWAVRRRA
jgi:hypothetical protein